MKRPWNSASSWVQICLSAASCSFILSPRVAGVVPRVDVVSRGRLNVGVGVGWHLDVMRNHGTTPATRGDKMNEQLAALKQIWTQDEAEFHGRFIDFDPIFSWPKPIQRPHPPIYIGG
jgi:alkanesulfonate monooxygenase SsuD/methylene tetrahydromethanopterin reductase-like flavin-dependent oxidoreductase (luciferase family)